MEIRITDDRIEALRGDEVVASLSMHHLDTPQGSVRVITDFQGSGDPQAILCGLRALQGLKPFVIGVERSNPKHDRLVRAYKRLLGATEAMTMLEIN